MQSQRSFFNSFSSSSKESDLNNEYTYRQCNTRKFEFTFEHSIPILISSISRENLNIANQMRCWKIWFGKFTLCKSANMQINIVVNVVACPSCKFQAVINLQCNGWKCGIIQFSTIYISHFNVHCTLMVSFIECVNVFSVVSFKYPIFPMFLKTTKSNQFVLNT